MVNLYILYIGVGTPEYREKVEIRFGLQRIIVNKRQSISEN